MNPSHTPDLLSVSGAARVLGRSERNVRQLEARGVLPAVRASNGYRLFRREDVEALVQQREAAGATA